jgi:hypothetical protein
LREVAPIDRIKTSELIFWNEGPGYGKRILEQNKGILKDVIDEEIVLVPNLLTLEGPGWVSIRKLSGFARHNIRSVAFYIQPPKHPLEYYWSWGKVYWTDVSREFRCELEQLENIYLIIDVEGLYEARKAPTNALRLIPGWNPARLRGTLEERLLWIESYAEGLKLKSKLEEWLVYGLRCHCRNGCRVKIQIVEWKK